MARQAFAVNEAVRERVRHLAGVGVRQDDIARIIGCAPKTLRKRLRDDIGVLTAMGLRTDGLMAALLQETRATHTQIARMNDRIRKLEDAAP